MRRLRNSLLCFFSACLASACNEHIMYHSYQPLPDKGWAKSDTLSFQISVTDSIPTNLRLFAEVRNRSDYPYRNLHLFVCHNLQDSTVWHTDTITINIADSTRKWLGSGWGSIYQSEKSIKTIRPLHTGSYELKVVSGMKDESIVGVNDIGIRIER